MPSPAAAPAKRQQGSPKPWGMGSSRLCKRGKCTLVRGHARRSANWGVLLHERPANTFRKTAGDAPVVLLACLRPLTERHKTAPDPTSQAQLHSHFTSEYVPLAIK
jgi:hypothetical protein